MKIFKPEYNPEYIYLIQTDEFKIAGDNVYKYGKTKRVFGERFKEYDGPVTVFLFVAVSNCTRVEDMITEIFNRRYEKVKGNEYFRGDLRLMMNDIINLCNLFGNVNDLAFYPCSDPSVLIDIRASDRASDRASENDSCTLENYSNKDIKNSPTIETESELIPSIEVSNITDTKDYVSAHVSANADKIIKISPTIKEKKRQRSKSENTFRPNKNPNTTNLNIELCKYLHAEIGKMSGGKTAWYKALKYIKLHPSKILSYEDAVKVDFVGPKIAEVIGGYFEGLNRINEYKDIYDIFLSLGLSPISSKRQSQTDLKRGDHDKYMRCISVHGDIIDAMDRFKTVTNYMIKVFPKHLYLFCTVYDIVKPVSKLADHKFEKLLTDSDVEKIKEYKFHSISFTKQKYNFLRTNLSQKLSVEDLLIESREATKFFKTFLYILDI